MLSGCIILYPHYLTLHYFYYFCSRKQRRRVKTFYSPPTQQNSNKFDSAFI